MLDNYKPVHVAVNVHQVLLIKDVTFKDRYFSRIFHFNLKLLQRILYRNFTSSLIAATTAPETS